MTEKKRATARRTRPRGAHYDAEALFTAYYLMGADRSLEKLHGFLPVMYPDQTPPTLQTIKRYSASYGWQDRIAEVDRLIAESNDRSVVEFGMTMQARQAALGRAMQALAGKRLASLTPADLNPRDLARLVDIGVKVERLAEGEATTRSEVVRLTYNRVIIPVLQVFQQVVIMVDDDDLRRRMVARFAHGVDAVRDEFIDVAEKAG